MIRTKSRHVLALFLIASTVGCSEYQGVVRPTKPAALAPELSNLTEASIEHHLKLNPKIVLPTVLAVAKLENSYSDYGGYKQYSIGYGGSGPRIGIIQGQEADRWRTLTKLKSKDGNSAIEQVQFITPLVCKNNPSIKDLRDAAAMLHAPLLLVYSNAESHEEGVNSAAMAYWTIIGLFLVPGNTVGHYSATYALLVDTQSGGVVATAEGESKKEENVLYGAVEIARGRTRDQATNEALAMLRKNVEAGMMSLDPSMVVSTPPQP